MIPRITLSLIVVVVISLVIGAKFPATINRFVPF